MSAGSPSQPKIAARSGAFFPSPLLPFSHPFLPYGMPMTGRTMQHHIQPQTNFTSELTGISNQSSEHTPQLSPSSSRPSASSSPSSEHSDSIKIGKYHDEQINVESAFLPILKPDPSIVGVADSRTVYDQVPRSRCDLKAPSSKKPIHATAPTVPRSPQTKLESLLSGPKPVWRPY